MSDDRRNLPPGPWSWEDQGLIDRPMGTGFVYLIDASGRKIGTFWGKPAEKVAIANLVVDARAALSSGGEAEKPKGRVIRNVEDARANLQEVVVAAVMGTPIDPETLAAAEAALARMNTSGGEGEEGKT